MKVKNVLNAVVNTARKIKFGAKKHSAEILIISGTTGAVAGVVIACVETFKGAHDILDEHHEKIEEINDNAELAAENEETYHAGREVAIQYVKTTGKFIKLYSPAVIIELLSLSAMIGSNNIWKKRSAAALAGYIGAKTQLDTITARLKETLTPEQYDEIVNGIKTEEITKVVTDEDGNEIEVTEKISKLVGKPSATSFIIDSDNPYWDKLGGIESTMYQTKCQLTYANQRIKVMEPYRMFLNDVLHDLGIPTSKEGQVAGWICDKEMLGETYYRPIDYEIRKIDREDDECIMVTFTNLLPDIYSDYPEVKTQFAKIVE